MTDPQKIVNQCADRLRHEIEKLRAAGVNVEPLRKAINDYRKAQSLYDTILRNEAANRNYQAEMEAIGNPPSKQE